MSAWCFATTLGVATLRGLVVRVEQEIPAHLASAVEAVDTIIRPDLALGVTVVVVLGSDADILAAITSRLAGASFAEEATRAFA